MRKRHSHCSRLSTFPLRFTLLALAIAAVQADAAPSRRLLYSEQYGIEVFAIADAQGEWCGEQLNLQAVIKPKSPLLPSGLPSFMGQAGPMLSKECAQAKRARVQALSAGTREPIGEPFLIASSADAVPEGAAQRPAETAAAAPAAAAAVSAPAPGGGAEPASSTAPPSAAPAAIASAPAAPAPEAAAAAAPAQTVASAAPAQAAGLQAAAPAPVATPTVAGADTVQGGPLPKSEPAAAQAAVEPAAGAVADRVPGTTKAAAQGSAEGQPVAQSTEAGAAAAGPSAAAPAAAQAAAGVPDTAGVARPQEPLPASAATAAAEPSPVPLVQSAAVPTAPQSPPGAAAPVAAPAPAAQVSAAVPAAEPSPQPAPESAGPAVAPAAPRAPTPLDGYLAKLALRERTALPQLDPADPPLRVSTDLRLFRPGRPAGLGLRPARQFKLSGVMLRFANGEEFEGVPLPKEVEELVARAPGSERVALLVRPTGRVEEPLYGSYTMTHIDRIEVEVGNGPDLRRFSIESKRPPRPFNPLADRRRGADLTLLGVRPGMGRTEAGSLIERELGQPPVLDEPSASLVAPDRECRLPFGPALTAGARCVSAGLSADGEQVRRIALRESLSRDALPAYIAKLRERYGEPVLATEVQVRSESVGSVDHALLEWGAPTGVGRHGFELERVRLCNDSDAACQLPAFALEADIAIPERGDLVRVTLTLVDGG